MLHGSSLNKFIQNMIGLENEIILVGIIFTIISSIAIVQIEFVSAEKIVRI